MGSPIGGSAERVSAPGPPSCGRGLTPLPSERSSRDLQFEFRSYVWSYQLRTITIDDGLFASLVTPPVADEDRDLVHSDTALRTGYNDGQGYHRIGRI